MIVHQSCSAHGSPHERIQLPAYTLGIPTYYNFRFNAAVQSALSDLLRRRRRTYMHTGMNKHALERERANGSPMNLPGSMMRERVEVCACLCVSVRVCNVDLHLHFLDGPTRRTIIYYTHAASWRRGSTISSGSSRVVHQFVIVSVYCIYVLHIRQAIVF